MRERRAQAAIKGVPHYGNQMPSTSRDQHDQCAKIRPMAQPIIQLMLSRAETGSHLGSSAGAIHQIINGPSCKALLADAVRALVRSGIAIPEENEKGFISRFGPRHAWRNMQDALKCRTTREPA